MPTPATTRLGVLLALAVLLASCGDEPAPTATTTAVPAWARVAPEQIAEAEKHGVPVAFENDLGMRFVLIPAGTFVMGSPEDEEGRDDDETQHQVTISKPFYMSICEVTNGGFRHFQPGHDAGGLGRDVPNYPDPVLNLNLDDQPAVNVSWSDAEAFSDWLATKDADHAYRLPTEAEWEYACRAGTRSSFAFGKTLRHDQASFRRDSGPPEERLEEPRRVGSFRPNAWGLHDMHGNASEYCADWIAVLGTSDFMPYPAVQVTDPTGPDSGTYKVVRGGSFWSSIKDLRSASRRAALPHDKRKGWSWRGFRLVSPLPEPGE